MTTAASNQVLQRQLDRLIAASVSSDDPNAAAWRFRVRLKGTLGFGEEDPHLGAAIGAATNVTVRLHLTTCIAPGPRDPAELRPTAQLTGTVRSGALGGRRPVDRGVALMSDGFAGDTGGRLAFRIDITGWEDIPLTLRGLSLKAGPRQRAIPLVPCLAFSLELWRGAPADRAEPEQMVASGVLHAGLLSTLQALAGFWRTAPPTQRPLALLLHRGRPVWTGKAGFSHRSLRSR